METTRQRLIQTTQNFRRTVHASLPWGLRLARVLFQIRFGGTAEDFGRLVYGLFLLYGVQDMPETPLIPKTPREISRLPRNYGSAFGQRMEKSVMKYFHTNSPTSSPEDFLSELNVKLLKDSGLKSTLEGKSLADAEKIIGRYTQNAAIDHVRYESHRKSEEISDVMESSGSWSQLEGLISESEQEKIMKDLEKAGGKGSRSEGTVAKELPLFFKLLLEGYTAVEILDGKLLPSLKDNPISEQALSGYRKTVEEVVRKHLQD